MSLTLVHTLNPAGQKSQKVLTLASFANVEVCSRLITVGKENEEPEYLRHAHPLGRIPTLHTPEGAIFESNAIVRYVARLDKSGTHLYGRTPFEASQVDMWLDYAATEINQLGLKYYLNFTAGTPLPADQDVKIKEALGGLEAWLETRTFLVGERLSAADIVVAFTVQWVFHFNKVSSDELAKKFKGVYRLYNTVMQQPKTVDVLRRYGVSFGAYKKPEEPKKKEEPKPKEAKKPEPKDDDEEDDAPVEKKKPNPLDLLPPSPFVLDAFKREYSNTDTRTVAAPWFFANFDAAGYSAYWCRYKYNEDNKMQFMTANLIRGWFQRMEHTRKYAFGVALIVGEDKAHDIVALWVFRGKGLPEIVTDVEDTELFTWEEIADVHAAKDRITDYLCWEGATIGKPVLEGRCFK